MNTDFSFPQAFFDAQWRVGLHTLEMVEICSAQCATLGAHMLQDACTPTGSRVERVMAAASAARLVPDLIPRRRVVEDALHSLHTALETPPSRTKKP